MKNVILSNNPGLDPIHAEYLAWEGLQETTPYKELNSTTQNAIGLCNMAARGQKDPLDTTTYNFVICE